MSGAILITKYWDNCADCPCGDFGEYAIHCTAYDDKQVCTMEEYFSHRKFNSNYTELIGTEKAPRPEWCPLVEVRGEK